MRDNRGPDERTGETCGSSSAQPSEFARRGPAGAQPGRAVPDAGRGPAPNDGLLDALGRVPARSFTDEVWRVVHHGRDPARGNSSRSRWCDGSFGVLYTSVECDGAIADLSRHTRRKRLSAYRLQIATERALRIDDLDTLARLGVDVARYAGRDYRRTQAIAGAAFELGFDGLIVPSAHWACHNLVVFTDRTPAEKIRVVAGPEPVDLQEWSARSAPRARQSSVSSMAYMSSSDRPK